MADDEKTRDSSRRDAEHEPPAEARTTGTWTSAGTSLDYTATANWTVLRRRDKPTAEIFSASYVADGDAERPVTFVFNGGPGASSAYLHMGVMGPQRVALPPDGGLPRMPSRLVANDESWLGFTDLVFVDPVGTGFSRVIEEKGADARHADRDGDAGKGDGEGGEGSREFFGYKRDLESLCEFMSRWLSVRGRWGSPVFIAGESYGGYRVGRLVRMMQETTGIGLNGAVLISPALELGALEQNDYNALEWVDQLPTMALSAVHHGRSRAFAAGTPAQSVVTETEAFATGEYLSFLARGAAMPAAERERVLGRFAELVGLSDDMVTRAEGRIPIDVFVRELLRDERKVLGLYDTTVTTVDPFPDRAEFAGADPTLTGIESAYTSAVNRQLRAEIGVQTDREYVVISMEVNRLWRNDAPEHFFTPPTSATDDFRYGMALNPHMRAFITHGRYDLVTPFYTTDRLRNLMRLDPQLADRLTVRHFDGGHMFYAWQDSRRAFSAAIGAFYAEALAAGD